MNPKVHITKVAVKVILEIPIIAGLGYYLIISDEILIDTTSPSKAKNTETECENLGKKIMKNFFYCTID